MILAIATGLVGCGGGSATWPPSPAPNGAATLAALRVMAEGRDALHRASSYHLHGMLNGEVTIDVHIAGSSLSGTETERGVTWQIVVSGGVEYLRGRALWQATANAADAARIGDSWVRGRPESAFSMTGINLSLPQAIPDVLFGDKPDVHNDGLVSVVTPHDAVRIANATDEYDYAAQGTPFPLRWLDLSEQRTSGHPCGLTLDEFNSPVVIAAPPGAVDAPPSVVAAQSPTPF